MLGRWLFTAVKFTEESHLTTRLALGSGVTTAGLTHDRLLLLTEVEVRGRVLVCALVARRTACRAVTVPAAIAGWLRWSIGKWRWSRGRGMDIALHDVVRLLWLLLAVMLWLWNTLGPWAWPAAMKRIVLTCSWACMWRVWVNVWPQFPWVQNTEYSDCTDVPREAPCPP